MSKVARLESDIKRALSEILRQDVKDPKIGFTTITEVRLTNDLSYLTIYYTNLNDEPKDRKHSAEALDRSKSFIRTLLAKRVKMRKSPQLKFKYDESLDTGNRIEKGLKDVMQADDE